MYSRVVRRLTLRTTISLTVCIALLPRYRKPSRAQISGKNITINSDGSFMAQNGTLPVMGRPGVFVTKINYYGLDDIASAAFILAHELGHRTDKLEKDSVDAKDPEGARDRNNQQVYDACFKN